MILQTSATGQDLLQELAQLFETYASDCDAMAARGYGKKESEIKARVWRAAAADCLSIKIVPAA